MLPEAYWCAASLWHDTYPGGSICFREYDCDRPKTYHLCSYAYAFHGAWTVIIRNKSVTPQPQTVRWYQAGLSPDVHILQWKIGLFFHTLEWVLMKEKHRLSKPKWTNCSTCSQCRRNPEGEVFLSRWNGAVWRGQPCGIWLDINEALTLSASNYFNGDSLTLAEQLIINGCLSHHRSLYVYN